MFKQLTAVFNSNTNGDTLLIALNALYSAFERDLEHVNAAAKLVMLALNNNDELLLKNTNISCNTSKHLKDCCATTVQLIRNAVTQVDDENYETAQAILAQAIIQRVYTLQHAQKLLFLQQQNTLCN
jgi:hypothetical protein